MALRDAWVGVVGVRFELTKHFRATVLQTVDPLDIRGMRLVSDRLREACRACQPAPDCESGTSLALARYFIFVEQRVVLGLPHGNPASAHQPHEHLTQHAHEPGGVSFPHFVH